MKNEHFDSEWERFVNGYHDLLRIDDQERFRRFEKNLKLKRFGLGLGVFLFSAGLFYFFGYVL